MELSALMSGEEIRKALALNSDKIDAVVGKLDDIGLKVEMQGATIQSLVTRG